MQFKRVLILNPNKNLIDPTEMLLILNVDIIYLFIIFYFFCVHIY